MRRLLALILAAIAAFLVAPQAAVTATSVTSVSVYTYDGHHHSAPSVGGTSERGPPAAGNHFANDNAVDRRSYGDSARPDIGESPAAYTYTYTDPAPSVQVTPTTWHRAEVADGQLIAFARGRVAAKSGDDLVDVWRVVGPDEAAGITKTGGYSVQLGGEGKYFFPTRGQAENLGQMYNKANWPGPQTLTRGQVPRSVISRAEPVNAGTEGPGWFIRSPDIPRICNVLCMGTIQ